MTYQYETIDFTYDGIRYKARGKTKEEAIKKKLLKLEELEKGKAAYKKARTDKLFRDYAKDWLRIYNKGVLETTAKDIEARLRKYILPYIGHIKIKDITRTDMLDMFGHMKGMSRDRIGKVRQTLKKVFEAAYDDGYIYKLPNFSMIELPEHAEDGVRRSIEPYERFLTKKVAEYHYAGSWVLTMLYTGLRPQETAALQGRHIDYKNNLIHVEQALKHDGKIGVTKTGAGRRTVPIPPALLPYLPKVDPFDYVFLSQRGRILSKKSMSAMWRNFKFEMNIQAGAFVYDGQLSPSMEPVRGCAHSCTMLLPEYLRLGFGKRDYPIKNDLTPYCYRHTFCTDAVTAGIPIELLKELAGHSNISVTSKYYVHMTDERMKQAAELLAGYHSQK